LDLIHIYQRLNVSGKLANNDIKGLMNDSVIQELQGHVETIRNKIISI
jgi:ribosomal protein S25